MEVARGGFVLDGMVACQSYPKEVISSIPSELPRSPAPLHLSLRSPRHLFSADNLARGLPLLA